MTARPSSSLGAYAATAAQVMTARPPSSGSHDGERTPNVATMAHAAAPASAAKNGKIAYHPVTPTTLAAVVGNQRCASVWNQRGSTPLCTCDAVRALIMIVETRPRAA